MNTDPLFALFPAENGYMNFTGSEFGHPERAGFPREGNGVFINCCGHRIRLRDQTVSSLPERCDNGKSGTAMSAASLLGRGNHCVQEGIEG